MASVEYPLLDDLRATLAEKAPFCSGTFEIPVRDFDLWYGKKNAQCVHVCPVIASLCSDSLARD